MEHIRIATFDLEDDTFGSVADRGLLRTFQEQPGFLRQSLVSLGALRSLSLTIWGTRHEADEAVLVAERWGHRPDIGAVSVRSLPVRGMDRIAEDAPAAI